ncbi:helix-turn-helix domain-containing protein [Streptomyces sp. NPDC058623]|uniref:helix-turn-helix domain-containing protein n=1 Tax=Streptomyces sp. NPDC058623 TaxID=3346563 RepID=UPI003650B633
MFDILFSRQVLGQSSKVSIKQEELAEVLRISQPKVSRAEAELRAKGIVRNPSRGRIEVHSLFGFFECRRRVKSGSGSLLVQD